MNSYVNSDAYIGCGKRERDKEGRVGKAREQETRRQFYMRAPHQ